MTALRATDPTDLEEDDMGSGPEVLHARNEGNVSLAVRLDTTTIYIVAPYRKTAR